MPVKTVTSATGSYCTADQFFQRYDWRALADLLSDTGLAAAPDAPTLAANINLDHLLREASGTLEAAALAGERYTATDLNAIITPDLAGNISNSGEMLIGMVATMAIPLIYRRRPDVTLPIMAQLEEAERKLAALYDGVRIFGFRETQDAGVADSEIETVQIVENRRLISYTARPVFGRRNNCVGEQLG